MFDVASALIFQASSFSFSHLSTSGSAAACMIVSGLDFSKTLLVAAWFVMSSLMDDPKRGMC